MQPHVNRGHASAQQSISVLVDSDGGTMVLFGLTTEAPERFDVCRASDIAPHLPIAGTSTAPSFNEKFQAISPFFDDATALHALYVYPDNPFPIRVRPGNPLRAWGTTCTSRITISARATRIQMDGGGEWGGKFERILSRGVVLSSSFRERARAPGSLGPAMELRAVFLVAWRLMLGFRARKC